MRKENVVRDKSYAFALRIVQLHRFLTKDKNEFVLSNQLLKSGTSIGANIRRPLEDNPREISQRNCQLRTKNRGNLITGFVC